MVNSNELVGTVSGESVFQSVREARFDETIYLVEAYRHLEVKCRQETDELERMAADITARTEAASLNTQDASTTGPSPVHDPIYDSVADLRAGFGQLKRLSTVQRGELSKKFGVPIHVFGNKHRRRGATDAEILALEVSHDRIENYLDQMFELIPEIAVSQPSTYAGISAKLEFVSELVNDNDQLRLDLVAKIVGNCAEQLASISTRELATQ